jgi:hypothetical protein
VTDGEDGGEAASALLDEERVFPILVQHLQPGDGDPAGGRTGRDDHASGHEPGRQGQHASRAGGESGIREPEQSDVEDQDQDGAAAVPQPAGRDASEGGGEVVGDVQAEGELGGPILAAARDEQLAGAQDEQGRNVKRWRDGR